MPPEPEEAGAPAQFSIATPADWMVVDFDVLADQAAIAGLVDARVKEEPGLDPYRDELAEIVARSAQLAEKAGILFCATLAAVRGDGAPIIATVAVAAGQGDPAESEPGRGTDLVRRLAGDCRQPHRRARRQRALRPGHHGFSAGPAARIERIDDVPLFTDTSMVCLTVQYVLEVPEAPDQFVALTFTTPSLAYRARLTELFGDIAATFAWA